MNHNYQILKENLVYLEEFDYNNITFTDLVRIKKSIVQFLRVYNNYEDKPYEMSFRTILVNMTNMTRSAYGLLGNEYDCLYKLTEMYNLFEEIDKILTQEYIYQEMMNYKPGKSGRPGKSKGELTYNFRTFLPHEFDTQDSKSIRDFLDKVSLGIHALELFEKAEQNKHQILLDALKPDKGLAVLNDKSVWYAYTENDKLYERYYGLKNWNLTKGGLNSYKLTDNLYGKWGDLIKKDYPELYL